MKNASDRKIILRYVMLCLAAIMLIVIFVFSSQTAAASKQVSDFFTNKIFGAFGLRESVVRKVAHFAEFAILGVFIMTFLSTFSINRVFSASISVFICALYAVCDEFHQLFVSGRSGQVRDVILDTCGAIFGVFMVYLILHLLSKKKES